MQIYDLEPQIVWKNFYALTQIPRPSGHTEKVAKHLVDFGLQHGAEAFIDNAGNVVMRKAATPGYENRNTVILQAHMDMVPQKTKESTHDFVKDPIETYIDGEWVKAKGTTLGSDNGMGVAIAMAVVESTTLEHGPLEILITRDEETGMYGASELAPETLTGKYLLNLDSEVEGEITIGCAGGMDVVASIEYQPLEVNPEGMEAYCISMKGLRGGHSGLEINEGRANANKLMARLLFAAVNTESAWLSSWRGGNMRNAIPRDSEAVVLTSAKKAAELKDLVEKCATLFNKEFQGVEHGNIQLTISPCDMPTHAVPQEIQDNLINAVMAAQNGVMRNLPEMPQIVETSSNLAIVDIVDGKGSIACLVRSASDSMKLWLSNSLLATFSMAGMKVKMEGGYSGWQPNTNSQFVVAMSEVYEKMYGKKPEVLVVHAGLECAFFAPKYPDMEMASIGPTLLSPHTPDERCHIPSVQKSYDYVAELLKNIPAK
jgi:dipeptidase D